MPSAIHLTRIQIDAVPGIARDQGFDSGAISPGVHLFTGPNGAGKSVTARAVTALLWQQTAEGWLQVHLTLDGVEWTLTRKGREISFTKAGLRVDPPGWDDPEGRHRHLWTLRDLLVGEDSDLARHIGILMRGGVDLESLAKHLGWDTPPAAPRKLLRDLQTAEQHLRRVRNEQEGLYRQSLQQQHLQQQMEPLRTFTRRQPLLEAAVRFQEMQASLASLRATLAAAPPAMDRLRSEDGDTWTRLRQNEERLQNALRRLRLELQQSADVRLSLPPDHYPRLLQEIPARLLQRERLRQSAAQAQQERIRQETVCRQLQQRTGLSAEHLAGGYRSASLRNYLNARLRAEAACLRAGLPLEGPPPRRGLLPLLAGLACAAGIAAHLRSLPPAAPFSAAALAIALLTAEWRHLRLRRHAFALRDQAQALLGDPPAFPAGTDPLWAAHFLEDVQAWRAALPLREAAIAAENAAREALNTFDLSLCRALGTAEGSDPEQAWAQIGPRWQKEWEQFQRRGQQEKELEQLEDQAAALTAEMQQFLNRIQLPDGDPAELERRLRRLPDWQRDFRSSEDLTTRLSEVRKTLADAPELLDEPPEALQSALAEIANANAEIRDLEERWTRVDQDLKRAKQRADLHEALESVDALKAELAAERSRHLEIRRGMAFMTWLKEKSFQEDRPQVFERANALLAAFTAGALQLSLRGEAFFAAAPGEVLRPLSALSSGERVQVLMAVRMAFLEQTETVRMPLFIDEALGVNDDERSARILEALIALAKEGRQILYFTAQSDERARWRQALTDAGLPYSETDLAACRRLQLAARRPLPPPPPVRTPLPQPDVGESPEDWARRVGIPAADPYAPIESQHLWHVLRDPQQTAALLHQGIETWGALRLLLQHGGFPEIDAEACERRARALAARHAAWRIGRPRPLRPEDLDASGCISDVFRAEVLALSERLGGDANALIQALEHREIAGFRRNKIDELSDWLREKGLLTDISPLSEEEIRARELAATERRP